MSEILDYKHTQCTRNRRVHQKEIQTKRGYIIFVTITHRPPVDLAVKKSNNVFFRICIFPTSRHQRRYFISI